MQVKDIGAGRTRKPWQLVKLILIGYKEPKKLYVVIKRTW